MCCIYVSYSMVMLAALLLALPAVLLLISVGFVVRSGRPDASVWGTKRIANANALDGPYRSGDLSHEIARRAPGLIRLAGGLAIAWGLLSVFVFTPLVFMMLMSWTGRMSTWSFSGLFIALFACDTLFVGFALMATGADVLSGDQPTGGRNAVRWSFVHHGVALLLGALLASLGSLVTVIVAFVGLALTLLLLEAVERVEAHRLEAHRLEVAGQTR